MWEVGSKNRWDVGLKTGVRQISREAGGGLSKLMGSGGLVPKTGGRLRLLPHPSLYVS